MNIPTPSSLKNLKAIVCFIQSIITAAIILCTSVGIAGAQTPEDETNVPKSYDSPEKFELELRIGPYVPEVGNDTFEEIYRDDSGLLLGLELDIIVFRLLNIFYLNVAAGIGYADYTGPSISSETGDRTDEESNFDVVPIFALAVARIDVLARLLDIPLIVTGKIGYTWMIWDDEKGERDISDGISHGLAWAGQAALDLDFFDKRSARMLDDEWGINHTFIFIEILGIDTFEGLELDEITWAAGLGFVF